MAVERSNRNAYFYNSKSRRMKLARLVTRIQHSCLKAYRTQTTKRGRECDITVDLGKQRVATAHWIQLSQRTIPWKAYECDNDSSGFIRGNFLD
jgi:hypothetical protein